MSKRIFTSESVTEGHPDKICDQISDGVLDAILAKDPQARVACECATTTGLVLVMGEITTNCYVDIAGIARDTITKIGYDNAEFGFDGRSCAVLTAIDKQSEDIAMGVDATTVSIARPRRARRTARKPGSCRPAAATEAVRPFSPLSAPSSDCARRRSAPASAPWFRCRQIRTSCPDRLPPPGSHRHRTHPRPLRYPPIACRSLSEPRSFCHRSQTLHYRSRFL